MASPPARWQGLVEVLTAGDGTRTSRARFWRRDDSPLGTAWGATIEEFAARPPPVSAPTTVRLLDSGRTGVVRPIEPPPPPVARAVDDPRMNQRRVEGISSPPFGP